MLSCHGKLPDTNSPSFNKFSSSKCAFRGLFADVEDERGDKEADHNLIQLEPSINSPPASCVKEHRTECIPSHGENKLDQFSLDGIETIDLTGEAAFPSPTTTDWEPPQPRDEGAISPRLCGEQRGKKRKKDECTPGLLAPSGTPSKDQTISNVDILEPMENNPAELPATPTATPSRRSLPSGSERSQRVIADEDSEDDSPATWFDIDTSFPDAGLEPPRSTSRGDRELETARRFSSQFSSNDATPPPSCIARNSNPLQSQSPESFPTTNVSRVQQADNSFMGFLAIHSETLGHLMSILKRRLHENAEVIYRQAIEGRLAPDSIAANQDLVSQIQTMESLQTSTSAYQNCATRKENLKQSLLRVISEGSDPTTMPELAQSRVVEAEMRKIEAQVRELLPRASTFDVACNFGIDHLSTWLSQPHALNPL
jgi:bloom syndrome protein